jgi:hypothetical protein
LQSQVLYLNEAGSTEFHANMAPSAEPNPYDDPQDQITASEARDAARWSVVANDGSLEFYIQVDANEPQQPPEEDFQPPIISQNLAGVVLANDSTAIVHKMDLGGDDPNGSNGTLVVNSLAIGSQATFDLTNNDIIIRTTETTKDAALAAINADIFSGMNGEDLNQIFQWNGFGIKSSYARARSLAHAFDLVNVGAIRNSDAEVTTGLPDQVFFTSFNRQSVDEHAVLIKLAYTGDTNFDGAITFDDYAPIDAAFFEQIPNLGWATGDINYDGEITFDDYARIDAAFDYLDDPNSQFYGHPI